MIKKITTAIPEEQVQKDLEKYRQRALELGATDAKVITTDMVIIDERVRAKCIYPKCRHYATNFNCPPYAIDLEQARKIVGNFRYAIFVKVEVPPEQVAGPEARDKGLFIPGNRKLHEIVSKIESEAFFDGYHLALAFGSGPCRDVFCPNIECSALVPGQSCRHSLRARAFASCSCFIPFFSRATLIFEL